MKLDYVGCLSLQEGRDHLLTAHLDAPPRLIVLGLTEAGLNSDSAALKLLHKLLLALSASVSSSSSSPSPLSIFSTDNVPSSGAVVQSIITSCTPPLSPSYLSTVTFHNAMVDCIVSPRPNSLFSQTPNREVLPYHAICLSPPVPEVTSLNPSFHSCTTAELDLLINQKLLVSNATHTCVACALCLVGHLNTAGLNSSPLWAAYVDSLVDEEIEVAFRGITGGEHGAQGTYENWRPRLFSATFPLSCYFISQGSPQKLLIRLLPSILQHGGPRLAFGVASVLRFYTGTRSGGVWKGAHITPPSSSGEYNGLEYGPDGYTFRDSTTISVRGTRYPLPRALTLARDGVLDCRDVIEAVLGWGLSYPRGFLEAAEDALMRLYAGNTCLEVLEELGTREEVRRR